jgi:hypothetical protein
MKSMILGRKTISVFLPVYYGFLKQFCLMLVVLSHYSHFYVALFVGFWQEISAYFLCVLLFMEIMIR